MRAALPFSQTPYMHARYVPAALRAYFAPCGMGLGHIVRCEAVLKKLRELVPVEAYFATYGEALAYARGAGFKALEVPRFRIIMHHNGEVDVKETLRYLTPRIPIIVAHQLAHDLKYMAALGPDVVISDTRAVAVLAAKLMRLPCVCILNQARIYVPRKKRFLRASRLAEAGALATVGQIWMLADEIFVPDFPEPFTISAMNLAIPRHMREKMRLVGPILTKRPEELPGQEELKEQMGFEPEDPLVFMPVTGTMEERPYFIRTMMGILRELTGDFQVVISMGLPDRGERALVNSKRFRVYYWVGDFYAYLKACDIAILRGGHGGITKCMAYGKPMLLVPPPSHTEKMLNVLRAKEVGVAKVLLQHELEKERVKEALSALLEERKFRERLEATRKLTSKMDAIGEIASAALRLASREMT